MTSWCAPDAIKLMPTITGCSMVPWAQVVADVVPRPAPVIYVNVGANKGYNVAEHMSMWSQHGVTNQLWHENILKYAQENNRGFLRAYSCGNCGACKSAAPPPHMRSGGRVHVLELTASNRALLRNLLVRAGLTEDVSVHDLAASNASGFITMRRTMAGDERASIAHGFSSGSEADQGEDKGRENRTRQDAAAAAACANGGSACEERIEVVRLDDFAAREGLGPIYTVSIDTEGYDALVIEGMSALLSRGKRRKPAIVEFEAHCGNSCRKAYKRNGQPLRRTLERLDSAGYRCCWQCTQP